MPLGMLIQAARPIQHLNGASGADMAYTAGFSVSVGDPTKATDVSTLAANDDFLKAAVDAIMADSATPTSVLKDGVTATTQSADDDSHKVSTTKYVDNAVAGASADPGGSNTQVQYNNSGAFARSANLTFNGSVLAVADGSDANPSLTNIDDTDTGIYWPAANKIAIACNGGTRLTVDSDGIVTMPTQVMFSASTSQANDCTGAGTVYTVPYSTEYFDIGSHFNHTTGYFTAPVDGKYFFHASVAMNNLTSAMDQAVIEFHHSGSEPNRSGFQNMYPIIADGTYGTQQISAILDLDADDTVHVTQQVSYGASDAVRVGATNFCGFNGFLIG